MDYKSYIALKHIDIHQVEEIILENKKNFGTRKSLVNIVVVSTLAYFAQKQKSKNKIQTMVTKTFNDETTRSYMLKVLDEDYDLIINLAETQKEDVLKAAILFAEPSRFSEMDIHSTPEGVAKLAISLLDIKNDDTVLDLGSGVGSFLIHAGFEEAKPKLNGVEINTECVIISNVRSKIAGIEIEIIQGNMISQEFVYLQANKIFSNFPIGMRWTSLISYINENEKIKKYFENAKRTVSGDWVYNLASILNQKKPGKTVVLMTNAGTWNKPDEEIRRKLVENGLVEGVILLPEKLFSSTMIPLTMMVFSHDNTSIKMVDASEVFTKGRRQNTLEPNDIDKIIDAYYGDSDISTRVEIEDIEKQEYILNPKRYVHTNIGIKNGIKLGEVCKSINRGAMIKSTELDKLATTEETTYRYLMLQNIKDGEIQPDLPNLIKIEDKYLKHCVNNNNLIISKISPFKIAIAKIKNQEKVLANGNLYFVDLDEKKINPIYVKVFLESELGIAQLNQLAKGTVMKSISIQDLKLIQIPNISREEQDRIAKEYETLCDELEVLQKQADLIRARKARLIEEVLE